MNKVEEGLTGWGSVPEKSTYLEKVHRLIEELLALLPAGHPVVVAIRKELAREKRSNQAGIVFLVVMLCLFGFMYAVAKYSCGQIFIKKFLTPFQTWSNIIENK